MIDPSSSEEEGEDDAVPNVSSKGRLTNTTKGTNAVSIIGGSAGSVVGSNIPVSGSNTDLIGNQRQSNISSICNRNDVGNISVAALGSTSNKIEQICGNRADTGNLEVPSNGIPRLVMFIQRIIFKHIATTISVHCVRVLINAQFFFTFYYFFILKYILFLWEGKGHEIFSYFVCPSECRNFRSQMTVCTVACNI